MPAAAPSPVPAGSTPISSVRIECFRSIRDVTLELGRVTVLIGANGSGKSNLVEGIAVGAAAASFRLSHEFLAARGIRPTPTSGGLRGRREGTPEASGRGWDPRAVRRPGPLPRGRRAAPPLRRTQPAPIALGAGAHQVAKISSISFRTTCSSLSLVEGEIRSPASSFRLEHDYDVEGYLLQKRFGIDVTGDGIPTTSTWTTSSGPVPSEDLHPPAIVASHIQGASGTAR